MITLKGYAYLNLPQPVQSSLLGKQPAGIYDELFSSCVILRSDFNGMATRHFKSQRRVKEDETEHVACTLAQVISSSTKRAS